jgi:hypothetical protein
MIHDEKSIKVDADDLVKKAFDTEIPEDVKARMEARFSAFQRSLRARPSRGIGWKPRVIRLAAAMTCAVALIIVIQNFGSKVVPPTWAEVGEGFASAEFVNATVYIKKAAMDEPVQFDLWLGHGGLLRMRAGNQVIFGKGGRITDTVEISGSSTPPEATKCGRELLGSVLQHLLAADEFTFDTFVRSLPGKRVISKPSYNEAATTSKDLVVYDIMNGEAADWFRVWALRESRLPIHVFFFSPTDGFSIDAVLVYSNQQPTGFFDADAFRESLKKAPVNPDPGYMLFK